MKEVKKGEENLEGREKKSCWAKFASCICCETQPIYPIPYQFHFNGSGITEENTKLFQSNYVRTSKYTPLSFFPKALIMQFQRLANVYFLVIAILQTIPVISPLAPVTAWAPLVFVLAISMIREGYEDFQRIKADRRTNYGTKARVIRDSKITEITWSEVVVGDIVFTEADQMFPADLILISSSNDGAAFIETASLDGEKNLKPRNAFKDLIKYNSEEKLRQLEGTFEGGIPDEELHRFSGRLSVKNEEVISVQGDKQLLYRGTFLKNTKWIYGLVILTGKNSKIVMNAKSSVTKMSQIERKVNWILLFILLVQIGLCFISALIYSIFRRRHEVDYDYINWPDFFIPLDAFFIFLTYIVLLNTMIPISLIVSIEVVKFVQKIFIERDKLLYSDLRKKGVSVKSASLNEELGQIEYVFSDKTGTLTMNIMEFKIAVIGEQMYGDVSLIAPKKDKKPEPEVKGFYDQGLKSLMQKNQNNESLRKEIVVTDAKGGNKVTLKSKKDVAHEYLQALSMAHEVIADVDKKGNKVFQGPSPDEITLVEAAEKMKYEFIKSTQSSTTIEINGEAKKVGLLELFAFNSDRKRMSVLIREDDGTMKLYMKGADSIVKGRLSKNSQLNLDDYLNRFSTIGLRTLLIAMKTVSEEEYKEFKKKVSELPPQNKEEPYNKLISDLEQDMYIIGATAVLDRLQDEVPETIRDLIRANIKVWMLTGDKMETAENIAKSCNLIQPSFEVLKYKPGENINDEEVLNILKEMVRKSEQLTEEGTPKGLLIEGSDLTQILKNQASKQELANLAKNCQAVVCCRLLPIQKADVVRVVRKYLDKITLAIGDGANDIEMIKAAHIGVGLHGEEGMGAVQACDYALPEFRMLWRIVLVHGRWNYIRISEMILYFFYKNMLFTMPQFYIAFYVGFSGQTIFDDWYVTLYNLAFTSLPLVVRAIMEQDVNYIYKADNKQNKQKKYESEPPRTLSTLVKQENYLPSEYRANKYFYRLFPKIYFIGQENCIFNFSNYLMWMLEALIESVIITFFTLYIISQVSVNSTGINSDYWLVSLTIYSTIILVVTFKLITHTKFWSWLLLLTIIITAFGFYCLHMWLTNFSLSDYVQGTTSVAWSSGECYLVVLLCTCIVLFVDGVIVFLDFYRGGYASKMRIIMKEHKMNHRQEYDINSLSITEKLTKTDDLESRKGNRH